MNICGVLVHAFPDRVAQVACALERLAGVELHGQADGGRIILTIEDTPATKAVDGLAAIHALPGVVAAALIYHHCEPAPLDAGSPVLET